MCTGLVKALNHKMNRLSYKVQRPQGPEKLLFDDTNFLIISNKTEILFISLLTGKCEIQYNQNWI